MHFVLASGSPRRLMLLAQIGIEADVRPSSFSELSGASDNVEKLVQANALGKGRDVLPLCKKDEVVIAADTVVVLDDKVIGKPKNIEEAKEMLRALSGRSHRVLTGIAVFYKGEEKVETVTTSVCFRKLTSEEIDAYIATGEPMDKAGAYGIQGRGALLVESIGGCYNNVVGLPLTKLYQMLGQLEVKLL